MRYAPQLAALVLLSAVAATAAAEQVVHVVPTGHEELVAELLGRGEEVGGCRLVRVDMHPMTIEGTYQCGDAGGLFGVVLGYPSSERGAAFTTRAFTANSRGPAPSTLLDALHQRILAHEAAWHWDETRLPAPETERGAPRMGSWWLPPAASGVAMLLVGAVALVRARRGRAGAR